VELQGRAVADVAKLASQTPSGISEEIEEDEAEGEVETTLYFDAEEGVLRDEDGDTVTFETSDEMSEDQDEEVEVEEEEEGTQTPQVAAAAEPERATQTIRSTLPETQPETASPGQAPRPGRLRRLSSATGSRVSLSFSWA